MLFICDSFAQPKLAGRLRLSYPPGQGEHLCRKA